MSLLFGVHAASFVDCESSSRDDAVLCSSCWERLNKNARTCGTGAIVSVDESLHLNEVGLSLDTIVLKCKLWSRAAGFGLP